MVVGGHLDSGISQMDLMMMGAGVVQSMDVANIFKKYVVQTKKTRLEWYFS
jgi:hypothetical protein